MILTNEFITVKVSQYDATLNQVNVALLITKNNPYYYNRQGILFVIYKTPKDPSPTRIIWFTEYNKDNPPVHGTQYTAADGIDYTVFVGDTCTIDLQDIDLNTDFEEDRSTRQYVNKSLINVYANDGIDPTPIFREPFYVNTVQMPVPIIKSFDASLIGFNQVKISWMGTNPQDFYEYQLWDSNQPTYPIFKASANANLKVITHTLSSIYYGKSVIFKLVITKNGTIFEQKSITVKLPKQGFDFFYKGEDASLKQMEAIYVKQENEALELFWNRVLFVKYKQAGIWYTD